MNFTSTKPRSAHQSLEQMAMLAIPVEDGKLARLARNLRNLCIFVHGQTHSVLTRVVAGPSFELMEIEKATGRIAAEKLLSVIDVDHM